MRATAGAAAARVTTQLVFVTLLVGVACDSTPRGVADDANELRGDCTVDGLRAADDACVEAFGRGADRLSDAMEVYAGALRTLERLAAQRDGLPFDTGFARMPSGSGINEAVERPDYHAPAIDRTRRYLRDPDYTPGPAPVYGPDFGPDHGPDFGPDYQPHRAAPDPRDTDPRRADVAPSYQDLADRRAAAYEARLRRRAGEPAVSGREHGHADDDRRLHDRQFDDRGFGDGRFDDRRFDERSADRRLDSEFADCDRLEYALRVSLDSPTQRLDIPRIGALLRDIEAYCIPYRESSRTGPRLRR